MSTKSATVKCPKNIKAVRWKRIIAMRFSRGSLLKLVAIFHRTITKKNIVAVGFFSSNIKIVFTFFCASNREMMKFFVVRYNSRDYVNSNKQPTNVKYMKWRFMPGNCANLLIMSFSVVGKFFIFLPSAMEMLIFQRINSRKYNLYKQNHKFWNHTATNCKSDVFDAIFEMWASAWILCIVS